MHRTSRNSMNNAMEIPRVFLEAVSLCAFLYLYTILCWLGLLPFWKTKITGREEEIKYFMCTMKKFLMSNCSQVLMYEGISGYGKSQLLVEIEYLAQGENHRWVSCDDHFLWIQRILTSLRISFVLMFLSFYTLPLINYPQSISYYWVSCLLC